MDGAGPEGVGKDVLGESVSVWWTAPESGLNKRGQTKGWEVGQSAE